MPTCRRKRVLLTEPSSEMLKQAKSNPNKPVFYLEKTGEIFDTYEAYVARMSFYRVKQFQCEVTGKGGLDYFQAIESERAEARTMHSRFSEPLKPAVLKAVQWQVMGRLDHLVEAVFDRFKDRYFFGERVLVDLSGTKYYAKVEKVYPPRFSTDIAARDAYKGASSSALSDEDIPHLIGGDLKLPIKEADALDDPQKYFYWVHVLEPEKGHDRNKSAAAKNADDGPALVGSLMEVQCGMLSRDRLSFSKSILRRFIRDCADRDAAVASPWTVKPAIAERYGVASVMPEETRQGVESLKKGAIDKRKKVWEDKEGPPSKKQKKMTPAQEEKAKILAVAAEKKNQEALDKSEGQKSAKDEAERLAAEKKKKKPVRYPTEDLDVRLGDKEKKAGMKVQRPIPSRTAVPFNDHLGSAESFLVVWNFLAVYGSNPMHLSPFTLDEFEHAIRHSLVDPPCAMLAEVHASLIYNLRTIPFSRHAGILSLLAHQNKYRAEYGSDPEVLGVPMERLVSALRDVGNNWERIPMRFSEGRQGWEDALVGCVKDHATVETFPRFQEVLTRLLFAPETVVDVSGSSTSDSRVSTPASGHLVTVSSPAERYHALPPADRIAILSFMCNLAISSKSIHAQMESSEEQLTALRKEKIEVNRTKKQLLEEISLLATDDGKPPVDIDATMESNESSDTPSDGGSTTKQKRKAPSQAKERELSRARNAELKHAVGERRRIDEEINKLERRLEGIEREFRKLLGAVRVKPLGRDRFFNRIWWFDGMGAASLIGNGGAVQYGTGRLFIQGPSPFDLDLLEKRKTEDIEGRRREEEGEDGMLGVGEWAVYTEIEEIDEFVAWLNPKGLREVAIKNFMTKWWSLYMAPGIRKRLADVSVNSRLPEARRSTRTKHGSGYDVAREPYMLWTNRRAVSNT